MGYTTYFEGFFTITPALTPEQFIYLTKFSRTRRMKRNADLAQKMPDPIRLAHTVELASVGVDGEYFVGGEGFYGQDVDTSVIDTNTPPSTQPGLWCQWTPSDDGTRLKWDGGEKFYSFIEWLEYLVKHFFIPWKRELNGRVRWQGEDPEDIGIIRVRNNLVESAEVDIAKILSTILPLN